MKKIYTISLDDDIPLSDSTKEEIKMLCFLVYDSIKNLDYNSDYPILNGDGIVYNELLESYVDQKFHYRFTYDNYESGKYEPFMIGDNSFGFSVNDDRLSNTKLLEIIKESEKILGINYKLAIEEYTYEDDKKHKNRIVALKRILINKKNIDNKKDKHTRVLKPLTSAISAIVR